MRIAFFSDSFWPELGGIQDSVLATGRALARKGHDVMFFAPSFSERDCRIAGVPPSELPLDERMEIHRCLSVHVPSSTLQSRFVIPTGQRWRALGAFRPDIIHTHTFLTLGLEAVIAAKRLRVPLIGTNHWAVSAFLQNRWVARRAARYVSWYYNHCRLVTAPSESVINDMITNGLRVPSRLLSNPIDTDIFTPASADEKRSLKEQLQLSALTVTYAGRLAPEKKIDVVMRALARLRDQFPDLTFALAGHGSARADLEKLAHELGVTDRVRFFGTLSPAALSELFRASDLFAIASTSETQSMTLLQAMASELPAVVVNSLALPEYVEENVTGKIVPVDDDKTIADAMSELLKNSDLRETYGEEAGRRVKERFGVEAVMERWELIYEKAATEFAK